MDLQTIKMLILLEILSTEMKIVIFDIMISAQSLWQNVSFDLSWKSQICKISKTPRQAHFQWQVACLYPFLAKSDFKYGIYLRSKKKDIWRHSSLRFSVGAKITKYDCFTIQPSDLWLNQFHGAKGGFNNNVQGRGQDSGFRRDKFRSNPPNLRDKHRSTTP